MFNIQNNNSIETNYSLGLLPQRNRQGLWYSDTSSRSDLANLQLSSENRRILRKTDNITFTIVPLPQTPSKTVFQWVKDLGWDFPTSSIKNVFNNHLFNTLYVWRLNDQIVGYSVCYFDNQISHIAYVFYDPSISHRDFPIRMVLQVVVDSHQKNLKYCYLGRDHTKTVGFYKRNMPGYEYFVNGQWKAYNHK